MILAALLTITALLSACTTDDPTADEIVSKSREHFNSAGSYEARTISYQFPRSDEPSSNYPWRIERPGNVEIMDFDGSPTTASLEFRDDHLFRAVALGCSLSFFSQQRAG